MLVLRRGHTVTSDFLVDVLWGDELPRNPANALQIQVSYLRKTLGGADPSGSAVLERAGGYALVVEPEQIDAHRFEVASRAFTPLKALRSEAELLDALDETERALALWRGDALEDVAGLEYARGEIARLDELRWAATERWVDLELRLGRHGATIGLLAELVGKMPLRERLHEQLVLALYRSGRQADALRAYGDARRTLVEELGIEPGPDLRDLEAMRIDLLRVHQQGVATGPRLQDRGPARLGATEGLAQIGDLDLERVGRIARQLVAPQHVDQEIRRHRVPPTQHQHHQDRPR